MNELVTVLLYFRKYDYAFTADIGKMFLKVLIPEELRKYFRFFWSDPKREILRILEFLGHLFGKKCSPPVAMFAIAKYIREHKEVSEEVVG